MRWHNPEQIVRVTSLDVRSCRNAPAQRNSSAILQGLALLTDVSGYPAESPMTLVPGATSPMHPG
eukprot:3722060-Alexandrium_andersonii.AAC.1